MKGVQPSVFIILTILEAKGCEIFSGDLRYQNLLPGVPIDRETLCLPEIAIDSFQCDIQIKMRDIFDIVLSTAALNRKDI